MPTKKSAKKVCSYSPVIFSQPAIDLLCDWFPDSRGNLQKDEVMDALYGNYGGNCQAVEDSTMPDVPTGTAAHEVLNAMLSESTPESFSPVLHQDSLTIPEIKEAYSSFNLNDIIQWDDADDNTNTGTLREVRKEPDGCGHYLILVNDRGGIDAVPVSLVTQYKNGSGPWEEFA